MSTHECVTDAQQEQLNSKAWLADRHCGLVPREVEIVEKPQGIWRADVGGEYFFVIQFCPFCGVRLQSDTREIPDEPQDVRT